MVTKPDAHIYIDGKRISAMREIAENEFGDSVLDIRIDRSERIFVLRIENNVDIKKIEKFSKRYKLCKIVVYPRIDFCMLKGKKI